eukprot:UN21248
MIDGNRANNTPSPDLSNVSAQYTRVVMIKMALRFDMYHPT